MAAAPVPPVADVRAHVVETGGIIDHMKRAPLARKPTHLDGPELLAWILQHTTPTETGCMLWCGGRPDTQGYGRINYGRRIRKLTHVVWKLTHGDWPEVFVCHSCDTPLCVNAEHLFLGTAAMNNADCRAKGRWVHGGKLRKLTAGQADGVRQDLAAGMSLRKTAKKYGVSKGVIDAIKDGKTYRT